MNRCFSDSKSHLGIARTNRANELYECICENERIVSAVFQCYTPEELSRRRIEGIVLELAYLRFGLDLLESNEKEYLSVSGRPHPSYVISKKKTEKLISKLDAYVMYRHARKTPLN